MQTPDSLSPYLITGATGFVGSHLAAHLWQAGASLRLLVRPSSDLSRLPKHLYEAWQAGDPRLTIVRGDLTEPASLSGVCEKVDGVFHVACAVKGTFDESQKSHAIFRQVNVIGTENLAREAQRSGVRMIHLSSTAAMGSPMASAVDETTPCLPQAPYQVSKHDAELRLLNLHETAGLDVVILRPCLILGPGKQGGEILNLFQLVRRGAFPMIGGAMECTKPLIDVRDVVQACTLAMDRGDAGEIYLIHSGADHTLAQIVEAARRLVGARRAGIPLPQPPMRLAAWAFEQVARFNPRFNPPLTRHRLDLFTLDRRISIEKAQRHLGFEPEHQDVYDMLGMTYIGYIKDGQLSP